MLRRRLVLVLVLATSLGLLTSYLVYKSVASRPSVQQAETEDVAVAAANIAVGEALTPRHLKMTAWPKATVLPGSLRSAKELDGRVARVSMVTGEPILESKLAAAGAGGLMPVLVPTGKRAVSIIVEQAIQKSGFVLPNSHVDVVVTMAPAGATTKKSRIVLQDITVLAADQTVEMKDNKPVTMTTVTMALTPEEAEHLALAQNEGRVTLALRNMQDTARVSTPGVTAAQLMGNAAPAPAAVKKVTLASGASAKRAPKAAVAASTPVPSTAKAPEAQPQAATHIVSVIRGVSATETVFTQDPERGWLETQGKTGTTKRP